MLIFRASLCICGLVAAPLLLLQGLANAKIAPGPIEWNGFWMADSAATFVNASVDDGQLNLSVDPAGLALAERAFVREPFATDALFLRAVQLRGQESQSDFLQLLQLASRLDKRNRQIGVLELEAAAVSGNLPQTFAVIDRLALTNPRYVPDFVQPLVVLVETDGALPVLRDALAKEPRWAEAFWKAVPESPDGVVRQYQLRQMVSVGTTPESDTALLVALGAQNRYDLVFSLWDTLSGSGGVDDVAFRPELDFAPIGWQPAVSPDRTFSELGDGQFDVFVEANTSGELARQLVRLKPGQYKFSMQVLPALSEQAFEASLVCAETDQRVGEPQRLDDDPSWITDESCLAYWLILTGSAWERRDDMRATISEMQFGLR